MGAKLLERIEEVDLWRLRGFAVFGLGIALYSVQGAPGIAPSALQPVEQLAKRSPGTLVLATIYLFFLNYRLFGSVLQRMGRVEGATAHRWRTARIAFSAIPLLGPYLLSSGRWTARSKTFWFLVTRGQRQIPPTFFLDSSLLLNLQLNLLVFQGCTAYLSQIYESRQIARILCALAFVAAQRDVFICRHRALISRRRGIFLSLLASLWLLSWPFWVSGWMGHIFLINTAPRPRHRMRVFFKGRLGLHEGLEESPRLDWWRASRWRLWRPSSPIANLATELKDSERLAPLYRFKVFLTVFEAMGFIILLALAGRRSPGLATHIVSVLRITVASTIVIVLLGGFGLTCSFLIRFFRKPLISGTAHEVLKYIVFSQASMIVGIYMGLHFVSKDIRRVGVVLIVASTIAAISTFAQMLYPFFSSRRESIATRDFYLVLWTALFSLGAAAGVAIRRSAALAFCFKILMMVLLVLTPVFAIGIALKLSRRFRPLLPPRSAPALWGAFFLCITTAFLPLGGLAVPLWVLIRRRSLAALPSQSSSVCLEPHGGKQPGGSARVQDPQGRSSAQELRDYFFANIVAHLATVKQWGKTCDLLEQTPFLEQQLDHFGGYGRSSADVETFVLPMALEKLDWNRFVQFMILALDLRGAAEDLPELIEPLIRSGRMSMALDSVNRIAGPLERAGAKAMIASELPTDSETYQQLLQSLPHDLGFRPPLPTDPTQSAAIAEKQFWILVVIAQVFGLAAREPLIPFLKDRPALWSDMIWINMAQRRAEVYGLLDHEVWMALGNVNDPELHRDYLPELLALTEDLPDAETLLPYVEGLSEDPELSWLCRFTLLDRIASTSVERAIFLWRLWTSQKPVSWSRQIAERAAPFLYRLNSQEIAHLIENMDGPEAKATLLMELCSLGGGGERVEETRAAIEEAPLDANRLHCLVRFLKMRGPHLKTSDIYDEITKIFQNLHEICDEVAIADLRCFFETVAEYLPHRLEQVMMKAFWAGKVTPECFFEIAETTESTVLMKHLLHKADQYILPFRLGEAEAFQVLSALLQRIVPRLCALTNNLSHLNRAIELNPDSEDEIRTATIKALTKADSPELAGQVCRSILSPRLRKLMRLKFLTTPSPDAFRPGTLLEAFADSEMVQDTVAGLRALASIPDPGCHSLQNLTSRVKNREERFLVLLRATERTLRSTRKQERQADLLDSLSQSANLVTADVQLAGLTPEITNVIALHSGRQTISEVREALGRLLSLRSVLWPTRRELCEALIARVLPLVASQAVKGRWEASEAARLILEPLQWIEFGSNQEIEEREIGPVLLAAMDRLPLQTLKHFLRELPSGSLFASLYIADDRELLGVLDHMVEENCFHPLTMEAVLYLLSYRIPDMVPEILGDLTPGAYRDSLAANLLCHGWLSPALAPEVLPLIGTPTIRMSTEITLGLGCAAGSSEEESWLHNLASIMSHQLVDPSDPRNEPWLRKLWTIDPGRSRPILGRGCLNALAQAGRWYGSSAFCLWFHAHLALDSERAPSSTLTLCAETEKAVHKALTLPTILASTKPWAKVSSQIRMH